VAAIYLLKTIAFPVLFIAAIPSLATAERSRTDYVMSGNLKQQKGDLDGAIKDYSQAIRLSAKSRFQLYDLRGLPGWRWALRIEQLPISIVPSNYIPNTASLF